VRVGVGVRVGAIRMPDVARVTSVGMADMDVMVNGVADIMADIMPTKVVADIVPADMAKVADMALADAQQGRDHQEGAREHRATNEHEG
jgi:hypothetical protein